MALADAQQFTQAHPGCTGDDLRFFMPARDGF